MELIIFVALLSIAITRAYLDQDKRRLNLAIQALCALLFCVISFLFASAILRHYPEAKDVPVWMRPPTMILCIAGFICLPLSYLSVLGAALAPASLLGKLTYLNR